MFAPAQHKNQNAPHSENAMVQASHAFSQPESAKEGEDKDLQMNVSSETDTLQMVPNDPVSVSEPRVQPVQDVVMSAMSTSPADLQLQGDEEGEETVQMKPELQLAAATGEDDDEIQPKMEGASAGFFMHGHPVQTKLTVDRPGDKYEQEADAVAERVMANQSNSAIQTREEEETLAAKYISDTPSVQASGEMEAPSSLRGKLNQSGSGTPLPKQTANEMGSKIGADFSGVNVHTDDNATRMNQSLGAKAFTHGNDIYFNRGNYDPGSSQGKHLLAHELTHVVQQGGANKVIAKVPSNHSPSVGKKTTQSPTTPFVQRQPEEKKGDKKAEASSKVPEDVRIKIAAIALAEAHTGQESDIAAIYLNIYKKDGESGLMKSAAYSTKSDNYKIYYTVLGKTDYEKDVPKSKWLTVIDSKTKKERKANSIREYVDNNGYFKGVIKGKERAANLKTKIDGWVTTPSTQPMKGWTGQGNLDDINNVSNSDIYWKKARAYFWLQKEGKAPATYLKVLKAGSNSQFVFHADNIAAYWNKNKLPDTVKKITEDDL